MSVKRPLISPDTCSGDTSWTDWVDHFEAVALVNGWDDAAKLVWLPVRLTGKAQVAWKRLTVDTRGSYDTRKKLSTSASNRTANGSCTRLNSTLGAGGEQSSGVTSLTRCTVWQTKHSRLLERKLRCCWRWTGI